MVNARNLLIIFALLPACEFRPQTPSVIPYTVNTPVASACVDFIPQEPAWYMNALPGDVVAIHKLKAILADLLNSRGYIEELKSILLACK